jgi:hypothetical protein
MINQATAYLPNFSSNKSIGYLGELPKPAVTRTHYVLLPKKNLMHLGATFVPVVLGGSTSLSTTIRSNREYPDRIGWAVSMMCKSRDGVNDTHPGRIEPHQGLKRQESVLAGEANIHPVR